MAPPTTVLGWTKLQKDTLTTALQNANTALQSAQANNTAATLARDTVKGKLAALDADMISIRKQLAGTVTPEDGAALLQQLQDDITNSRKTTAALAEAERTLAGTKADTDLATAEVQRITIALANATAAWKDAQVQDKRRTDLQNQLAQPPLSTIVADAATAAGGAAFTAAKTRLENDLPVALKTQAEERLTTEGARSAATVSDYQQALTLLEARQSSDGGINGPVGTLQSDFQRADAAFTAYVTGAIDHLNQANALLAKVGDPTVAPLTPAQTARIHDAVLVPNATTAAALEAARNDAAVTLAQKQAALDQAIRQAIAANVDADPATDPGVQAATTGRDAAQTALTGAQGAYTPAIEKEARDWEVTVPDSTWQLLRDFERASSLLAALQNPTPAALATAMDNAENALVTALIAADKSVRTLAALSSASAKQAAMAAYESAAADGRQFSAVRGDF
jgi:hypothetical protein